MLTTTEQFWNTSAEKTMMLGLAVTAAALTLYFLLAGLTFAAMYRWPKVFNGLVLSRLYAPLEAIAQRSRSFRRVYTLLLALVLLAILAMAKYDGLGGYQERKSSAENAAALSSATAEHGTLSGKLSR